MLCSRETRILCDCDGKAVNLKGVKRNQGVRWFIALRLAVGFGVTSHEKGACRRLTDRWQYVLHATRTVGGESELDEACWQLVFGECYRLR